MPGNPILIIVPSGIASAVSSRQHKWITQLGSLGMVATVHTHIGLAVNRMTMMVCMDQLVQATRAKIHDIRSDCPGRPIILVGFNAGAALACQVTFYICCINFFSHCYWFLFNTSEKGHIRSFQVLETNKCKKILHINTCFDRIFFT